MNETRKGQDVEKHGEHICPLNEDIYMGEQMNREIAHLSSKVGSVV